MMSFIGINSYTEGAGMKKLIYLFVLAILVSGCTTTYTDPLTGKTYDGNWYGGIKPYELEKFTKDRQPALDQYYKDTMIVNGGRYKKIKIGMTKDEVSYAWGEPLDSRETITSYGTRTQWDYYKFNGAYLYFKNGILTSLQK